MAAKKKKSLWNFADSLEGDKVVWIIVLMLILFSIVCIFSSTSRLLEGGQTRLDIVRSQLFIVAGGLALIIICYNIKNIKIFQWCSKWGFLLSLILLVLLLMRVDLPFLKSIEINGARRILRVAGFQLHVFEVVKVAMVMYMAWAIDALKNGNVKWPKKYEGKKYLIWKKIVYLYIPFLVTFIMVLSGSNSAALFLGGMMFIILLLGGGNAKELGILALSGIVLLLLCIGIYKISNGKVLGRIGTGISRIFDDEDWEKQARESKKGSIEYQQALDEIRQPYSAKIAVHEGGFLGKGPGQSTQRYVVPDISEDYMFSFIIEEYGLLGAILVIFLYVSLMARATIIVRNCGNDLYAKLSVAGLAILITGQAFLHMFVNADIGPMTGQTLPLISHGNSAFLCFSLAFGIILSFSRIASRKINKEIEQAVPLVEAHETVQETHGEMTADDELMNEYNEYDIQED